MNINLPINISQSRSRKLRIAENRDPLVIQLTIQLSLFPRRAATSCTFVWPKWLPDDLRPLLWREGMYIGLYDAFCRYCDRSADVRVTRLTGIESLTMTDSELRILGDRLRLFCEDLLADMLLSIKERDRLKLKSSK